MSELTVRPEWQGQDPNRPQMTDEEKKAQIEAMSAFAREQREYERKRSICMDEAVLIATMIRQRIVAGLDLSHVTGDGVLQAAATIYAEMISAGRGS